MVINPCNYPLVNQQFALENSIELVRWFTRFVCLPEGSGIKVGPTDIYRPRGPTMSPQTPWSPGDVNAHSVKERADGTRIAAQPGDSAESSIQLRQQKWHPKDQMVTAPLL